MKILQLNNISEVLPSDFINGVYAIGSFDGIHLGHVAILQETKKLANSLETFAGVILFNPQPKEYMGYLSNAFITSNNQQINEIAKLGIDKILILPFADVHALNAQSFVADIIKNKLQIKGLVSGENFYFGSNKTGSVAYLKEVAPSIPFKYVCVPNVIMHNNVCSSSIIRLLIQEGKVEEVPQYLGRNFIVESTVIHGNKRGRTLGFPTANLNISNYISLKYGVYSVNLYVDGIKYKGIANFGMRPSIKEEKTELLEVNIFNFDENIYDKQVSVEFLYFIRAEQKFESLDALMQQIQQDVMLVKNRE
jgi:riboflavin kinase/FMN adenylyltransferase